MINLSQERHHHHRVDEDPREIDHCNMIRPQAVHRRQHSDVRIDVLVQERQLPENEAGRSEGEGKVSRKV